MDATTVVGAPKLDWTTAGTPFLSSMATRVATGAEGPLAPAEGA